MLQRDTQTVLTVLSYPEANTNPYPIAPLALMSDLNRGIMKFKGADSPLAVALSGIVILGSIAALIGWALSSAYAF